MSRDSRPAGASVNPEARTEVTVVRAGKLRSSSYDPGDGSLPPPGHCVAVNELLNERRDEMWPSHLGAVEVERKHQQGRSHFISPAVANTLARWKRLRKDPLFVVLCIWAL